MNGIQLNNKQAEIRNVNILSEDGTLKYDFMTSLENIAMAKIISGLWMNQNTQQEIVNLFHNGIKSGQWDFNYERSQIKNNVVAQVSKLLLAKSITKKLANIVPFIGNSIFNWIRYHDEHIFKTNKYSEYSAVDQISNIKWTTRGKIDYAETARNILANQENSLSDDHKYKLACTYCLEDEIVVIAPKVVNQSYLNSVKINIYPMVYFWTAHITGDINKFPSYFYYNSDENILELLINNNGWAKRTLNEVPIRYMWDKLSEEVKTKNIILLVAELGNQDLRYSLLSNLSYEQQREIFKKCSGSILGDMFNDWLWGEYFLPTALHVLDIMNPSSYFHILEKIFKEMIMTSHAENKCIYDQYKYIFKQLWLNGSKRLKDSVFEHENGYSLVGLAAFSLSWKQDIDIIKLILDDLNTQQKKDLIFGYEGIGYCAHLIQTDQWDLLELFITHTLSSSEDLRQLKRILIKDKGLKIAVSFLVQEATDKVEQFMKWSFESDHEINQFKQSLAYTKICDNKLESLVKNNKVDFAELDKHFKWCASSDPSTMSALKTEIPKLYFLTVICELIENDKYDLLDQVLNWCFAGNRQQIAIFKSSMYKDSSMSYFLGGIIWSLKIKDRSLQLIDKLVTWCFTKEEEAKAFKKWMLYTQQAADSIGVNIVDYEFELADKFINWCITSNEEINKFKNALMLSSDMRRFLKCYFAMATQDDLVILIKWFNPSNETAKSFKKIFPDKKCPHIFYNLLDEFIQKK